MSDYNDDAKHAKKVLAEVSETFCLAKFLQTSLHLTTGHTNSCYHPPPHKIDTELIKKNPKYLHTTMEKRAQQGQMIQGERPSGCDYCWKMEDKGSMSDRHYRSGEPWAMTRFGDVYGSLMSSNPVDKLINPSYVEVDFNSACNLKCMYCSPQYSSTWMADSKLHGAYPTTVPHNDPVYFTGERRPIPNREENPYTEAFWKWWPELYKELKHFRMTGGEPLLDPNTYKVFDYILEHPKPDLHLNVTSNFSVEPTIFKKYMEYSKRICDGENVEHMMQFVSLDCFGPRSEYIRNGLDFNRLWDNVNTFLDSIPGRNSVTFIITMNALSLTSLRELMTAIYGLREIYSDTYQRVWFDVPILTDPKFMSIQMLPDSYQSELQKTIDYLTGADEHSCPEFTGFKDFEVDKMKRNLEQMKVQLSPEDLLQRKIDFNLFFAEYDKRQQKDFLMTFPEMEEFWNECEYLARQANRSTSV